MDLHHSINRKRTYPSCFVMCLLSWSCCSQRTLGADLKVHNVMEKQITRSEDKRHLLKLVPWASLGSSWKGHQQRIRIITWILSRGQKCNEWLSESKQKHVSWCTRWSRVIRTGKVVNSGGKFTSGTVSVSNLMTYCHWQV